MQKIVQILTVINYKSLSKNSNIIFAGCKCGCGEHSDRNNDFLEFNICKGCNNFMSPTCIKYDNSLCLICIKNKGIDTSLHVMCALCGNIMHLLRENVYCAICRKNMGHCRCLCLWRLCKKCKDLPFAIPN